MLANFSSEGTFAHDNLIAGDMPRVSEKQTVLSGAGALAAGTVLAKDSGNANKLVPVNDASGTASIQTPYAILADAVDATSADAEAVVFLSGHFNETALTFGGDDTADDHRAALRGLGIFTTPNMGA
jgi:hypothetical protein